ncbi:SMP-30/gluconolactonase/LRE family protein [Minwuia thermotolerans]|uniref:SMP-30/gluconolactonase/LRE family protein n=1 Tax=Minwuia thermotolerans TaxID=2056226 RepID=UPI000D6DC58E|nr:SMP-30/gluconolactonase/LRE family protein [Minwuia thermotolerans]
MLPSPPDIETRVFARVPEELQAEERPSRWLDQLGRVLGRTARMGSFLEGPSFDRDGNLYLVDLAHGRIFRVSPDAEWSVVADYDGQPNGLKIHRDGRIIVTDQQNGLVEIDPVNGKVTPFLPADLIHGYKGVNDLFFAENGDCYFTDQGQMTGLQDWAGRVMRYTPAGRLEVVLDKVPSPNGLVMNLAETTLHVAVTQMNAVWRVPFLDEKAVKVGVFTYLMAGIGPDGLALDTEDNLAIAHPGNGQVWLFDPHAVPIARLVSCAGKLPTNVAYGGPDNKQLFITESETGTVLVADLPVPGKPMYSHM